MQERTFIMVKPDGVQRKLVGKIIKKFEKRGLKVISMKLIIADMARLQKHYEDLMFKDFLPCLISYMLSGPVVCMILEGKDAVKTCKLIIGNCDPKKALPGTIRGDFAIDISRNLVHGSDSLELAKKEITLWFDQKSAVEWKNSDNSQIYE